MGGTLAHSRVFGALLVALAIVAPAAAEPAPRSAAVASVRGPATARISACFVPAQHCIGDIVAAIEAAREEIRVQAYRFTSVPILRALAAARARGVDVAVILDKSNDRYSDDADAPRSRYSGATYMANAGVPVWIDFAPAIAHNKLIILDRHLVIGGSYNYTMSAERRNAENVTFIDSPEVAEWFLANWTSRRDVARRFQARPAPRGFADSATLVGHHRP